MTEQIVGKCSKCGYCGNVEVRLAVDDVRLKYAMDNYFCEIEKSGFLKRLFNLPKKPTSSDFIISKNRFELFCRSCKRVKELPTIEME